MAVVTKSGFQIALPAPGEPLMFFQKRSQPWMVVLTEEVGNHAGPGEATVEQKIG